MDHLFPKTMLRLFGVVSSFVPSKKEVTSFVPGKEFKDSEFFGFEKIGKHVQSKHQPQMH
ncbi:MAG TPA: hypothetical protein VNJ08_01245 [Bacteriovoracaceae bacterium]|nr:hypothetical protein [Bacteriovoracaceae bacterium]